MNKTKIFLKTSLFGFSYAMASLTPVWADDIEVYFNNPNATLNQAAKPNVLFVFDTSGSFNGQMDSGYSRREAAILAVEKFIKTGPGKDYNIGIMRFNHGWGGSVVFPIKEVSATLKSIDSSEPSTTKTVGDELILQMKAMGDQGLSNIRSAYYEAGRYILGMEVDFGITRGANRQFGANPTAEKYGNEYSRVSNPLSLVPNTYSHFIPSGCSKTISYSGTDFSDAPYNDSDCEDEKLNNFSSTIKPRYQSPISANSCGGNHIIIISDSASGENSAADTDSANGGLRQLINPTNPTSVSCEDDVYTFDNGETRSILSEQVCVPEFAEYLSTAATGKPTVKTSYILYNDPPNSDFRIDTGKYYSEPGKGLFLQAATPEELSNAFEDIARSVIDTTSTFVTPSAAVNAFNRLYNRDELYFSVFKPSLNQRWDGNLKKYKYKTTNTAAANANDPGFLDIYDANNRKAILNGDFDPLAKSFWSSVVDGVDITKGGAGGQITSYSGRTVYTFTGSYSGTTPSTPSLTASTNLFTTGNTALTATMVGTTATTTTAIDTQRTNLINWARGQNVSDINSTDTTINPTTTRHVIADPLHSRPATVNYGGTATNPDTTIYLGTNAGFLHAINASNGTELFSFIPKELLSKIPSQFQNDQSEVHLYGLDSSINSWTYDADKDGIIEPASGDHVYLFFGMRRGGNNYYAMDVTDRTQPKLKWVIRGGTGGTTGFAKMGQSWAEPLRTKIKIDVAGVSTTKNVLILTGGYDTSHDTKTTRTNDAVGGALYIVDAQTGALLWSGSNNADTTTPLNKQFTNMNYSITAAPAAIDIDRDGFVDQLYVGDLGGQVWRFDISNGQSLTNLVTGGVIADLGVGSNANPTTTGNTVADNRRFYHSPEVALSRNSNGQLALSILIGSGYREHPLTTNTNDRFYAIKQTNVYTKTATYGTPLKESDLYDATTDNIGALTTAAQKTALIALEAKSGWLLRLTNSGEKVMSAPLAREGAIYFSTYEPTANSNSCQAVFGTNRFYGLNINTAAGVDGWANVPGGARSSIQEGVNFIDRPTTIVSPTGDIIGISSPTNLEDTNDGIDNGLSKTYWQ